MLLNNATGHPGQFLMMNLAGRVSCRRCQGLACACWTAGLRASVVPHWQSPRHWHEVCGVTYEDKGKQLAPVSLTISKHKVCSVKPLSSAQPLTKIQLNSQFWHTFSSV